MAFFAASCSHIWRYSEIGVSNGDKNICFGTICLFLSCGHFFARLPCLCVCIFMSGCYGDYYQHLDMRIKKSSNLPEKFERFFFFSFSFHDTHAYTDTRKCYIIIEWKVSIDAKWREKNWSRFCHTRFFEAFFPSFFFFSVQKLNHGYFVSLWLYLFVYF